MDVGSVKDATQAKVEGKSLSLLDLTKLMCSVPGPLRSPILMYPDYRRK